MGSLLQLCVKFAGIQHQEYLFKLAHPEIANRSHLHDAKDDILAGLLQVIQSLPLEMIGEFHGSSEQMLRR
jgi:hypothetical protein